MSGWIFRVELDKIKMHNHNISLIEMKFLMQKTLYYNIFASSIHEEEYVIRIPIM